MRRSLPGAMVRAGAPGPLDLSGISNLAAAGGGIGNLAAAGGSNMLKLDTPPVAGVVGSSVAASAASYGAGSMMAQSSAAPMLGIGTSHAPMTAASSAMVPGMQPSLAVGVHAPPAGVTGSIVPGLASRAGVANGLVRRDVWWKGSKEAQACSLASGGRRGGPLLSSLYSFSMGPARPPCCRLGSCCSLPSRTHLTGWQGQPCGLNSCCPSAAKGDPAAAHASDPRLQMSPNQ
jgi:hypothetical protein